MRSLVLIAKRSFFTKLFLFLLLLLPVSALAETKLVRPNIEVELVADSLSIMPGEPIRVGVLFQPEPGWHVYWKYAGDSGRAPKLKWIVDPGTSVGALKWPIPKRIPVSSLVNFGYEGSVILFREITTSREVGTELSLEVEADWLVCKEECIPGKGTLNLRVAVKGEAPQKSKWYGLFQEAELSIPKKSDEVLVTSSVEDSAIKIEARARDGILPEGGVTFFPSKPKQIINGAEQTVNRFNDAIVLTVDASPIIQGDFGGVSGILVADEGWAGEGRPSAIITGEDPVGDVVEFGKKDPMHGFFFALLLAFAGGIILNVMPCVFPILSLKVLGILSHSEKERREVRTEWLLFGLGVILSFLVLGGLLLGVRESAGGWGFQLQSPGFVYGLAIFVFILGLNLAGVFEVGGSLQRLAGGVHVADGPFGSFLSGILATVLATPCTAPFMGTAIAAAVTMPTGAALSVFAAVGFGMAFPYAAMSLAPRTLSFLPRPGPWMETFKSLMSFPLFATVVWLASVLGNQIGLTGVISLMAALVGVAFGMWLYGEMTLPVRSRLTRRFGAAIAVISIAASGFLFFPVADKGPGSADVYGLVWEPYSQARVNELISAKRNIYIDFTAAWCITCQVNKALVFSSDEVKSKFRELNVALVKGDWTSSDPAITRALESYGRNGVPLNIVYIMGEAPTILPSVLTPGIVLDALSGAPSPR